MATIHYVINTDLDGNENSENPLQVQKGPAATYIPQPGDQLMVIGKQASGFPGSEDGNISQTDSFLGSSTGLTSKVLTDSGASFGGTDAQAGNDIVPNRSDGTRFRITASTATTLTIGPGNMTFVATSGDEYAILPAIGGSATSTDFPFGFMASHVFIAVLGPGGGAKQGILSLAGGTPDLSPGTKITVTGPHATEGTQVYTQILGIFTGSFFFFKKFTGETS